MKSKSRVAVAMVVSLFAMALYAEQIAFRDLGITFSSSTRFSLGYHLIDAGISTINVSDWDGDGASLPIPSGRLSRSAIRVYILSSPMTDSEQRWYRDFLGGRYPTGPRKSADHPAGRLLPELSLTTVSGAEAYTLSSTFYAESTIGAMPNMPAYRGYSVLKAFDNTHRIVLVELESREILPEFNRRLHDMFYSLVLSR